MIKIYDITIILKIKTYLNNNYTNNILKKSKKSF